MTVRVYIIAADTQKPLRFANADRSARPIEAMIEVVEIRDLANAEAMRATAIQFHHHFITST